MKLGPENLEQRINRFEETAAAWVTGVSDDLDDLSLDLDDLVIDTFSEVASSAVNGGENYDLSHDAADAMASAVNNGGAAHQVATLLALGWTISALEERLDLSAGPSPA